MINSAIARLTAFKAAEQVEAATWPLQILLKKSYNFIGMSTKGRGSHGMIRLHPGTALVFKSEYDGTAVYNVAGDKHVSVKLSESTLKELKKNRTAEWK